MKRFLLIAGTAGALAGAPRLAAAQQGGYPVATTAQTQFVYQNGAVVQREGPSTKSLTQNVRLANGIKINYKSGIVEFPGGKLITLREGDFVRPDGSLVFATPGSAAAARGDGPAPSSAPFTTYTLPTRVVPGNATAETGSLQLRVQLLERKVELLNRKVALLNQGQAASPGAHQIDLDLAALDAQLQAGK
ncbi:DUF6799 domain-containing protein [Hymenobacter nivis]|uniref:DUF6799 domain-containing protein n=1 Tax=Hymenobacter nivis TaxID=1850093 RepID=A0A2Z3GLG6_9BACT|nr:DUF6799 domain-containing protein [Hymenobacter nivis]AWM35069.1 hypothetical protein DDQ68_21245 [Hymenobacter nivis]